MKRKFAIMLAIVMALAGASLAYGKNHKLEWKDFTVFKSKADQKTSGLKIVGKFGNGFEVTTKNLRYGKANYDIHPEFAKMPDEKKYQLVLKNLKKSCLEEAFLERKGIRVSDDDVINSIKNIRENLSADTEAQEGIEGLIAALGVDEDTYWNEVKFQEERRFLIHETFKAIASKDQMDELAAEASKISDFVVTNPDFEDLFKE